MEKLRLLKEKLKNAFRFLGKMGKNIDPNLPLEQQYNVTLREYMALGITKIGTQMMSIVAGSYGSVFLYECFYGSQGITTEEVANISSILTTVTTILSYLMGVVTATVAFKWRTKYGRYRQWFILGLIPYILLNILAFIVPSVDRSGLIAYKFIISIASCVLSGFYGISGNIVQVISPNAEEKKTVITTQQIFYYVGYGLAYVVPFIFGFISDDKPSMYLTMIIMSSIIAGVGSVLSFLWCKERIDPPQKKKTKITGATIGLFKYKNYLIYHIIGWSNVLCFTGEMITYLSAIVVGSNNAILFALPSAIGTGVGVAVATVITKKFEPTTILKWMGVYTPVVATATFLSVCFNHNYSSILFFICYFFFGISFGIADMAKSHLDVEFNDFLEWKTGERVEAVQGVVPGWFGSALSYGRSVLLPYVLFWIGYDTNIGSDSIMEAMKSKPTYDATCLWLLAIALFGTAIPYLIRALLLTFFYDVKGEKKKKMYEELSVLRSARTPSEEPSVTALAEDQSV